ncbi:MAG: hypothetical protein QXO74_02615 [Candidatus Methanomethylicia archaeon]
MFRASDLLGKRILLVGDVGSGKTILTLNIVNKFIELGFGSEITILDFAPISIYHSGRRVGGKLIEYSFHQNLVKRYVDVDTYPPRILGKCRDEVLMYAKINRCRCESALKDFIDNPSNILIINDVSIYYHIGDLGLIVDALKLCKTFIGNAYFNGFIEDKFSTGISINEREMTKFLMNLMDLTINLNLQSLRLI